MESSTASPSKSSNSFASKVKAVLMRAWRERWSDHQWGVQLKAVIGASNGDVKELPEILLHQALVGPNPNMLILGYLKHIVLCQMVPPCAALNFIQKYEDISKPYCTIGLIDLAETFASNLSFTSGLDSSLMMCKCLQNTLHWLMMCTLQSLKNIKDIQQQHEFISIIDSASVATHKIADNPTVQALLYVAMSEDLDNFREFEQTVVNVRGTLSQSLSDILPAQTKQKVGVALQTLSKVQDMSLPSQPVFEVSNLGISPTINTLVALEAILNQTSDIQPFVDQLCVTTRLLKLSRPYLYCEIFRACFMGLINIADGTEELKWAAFTYLKLPQILIKINQQAPGQNIMDEVYQGFNELLNSVPVLDLVESKLKCECFKVLLGECAKYDLLEKNQIQVLLNRRSTESNRGMWNVEPNVQASPSLIIRVEPTVHSILKSQTIKDEMTQCEIVESRIMTLATLPLHDTGKDSATLDSDCTKKQDSLLGVLFQMLTGKSFELILSASAAIGKLQNFANKLVKINEFAKQSQGEAGKAAQTRALVFDISFLMLCHISQIYGLEIIAASPEFTDSFFVQWAMRCLPEDGKYKCVDNFTSSDQNKTDKTEILIGQLTSGMDIKFSLTRWQEVCWNFPAAVQEILIAWEHSALNLEAIQMILERTKNKMCCIPVILCSWLCSYINTVPEEAREKPFHMIQILQNKVMNPDPEMNYNDRYHMMTNVLQKIVNDILPPSQRVNYTMYISPTKLPSEVMHQCMKAVFKQGWLDIDAVHTLEQLLNLCGSDWFCDRAIEVMLDSSRVEDLTKALSLIFATFHMDLEHIALSLLFHTLPKLLQTTHYNHMLTDPRGNTLAKLTVMIIVAAQNSRTTEKDIIPHFRRGRKRSRKEVDLEDMDETECRPVKRSKSSSLEPQLTLDSEGFNFDFLTAKEDGESSPTFDTKDPLNKSLANLMRLMNALSQDSQICPRISFIISFINEAIRCGSQNAKFILQFTPPQMISNLLKSVPGILDNQKILHVCDLTTSIGRKVASQAICQNSKLQRTAA